MKKIITVLLSVIVAFAALSSVSGCSSTTLSGGYKYTLTPVEEVSGEELEAAAKVIEERLISVCSKAEVKISGGKLNVGIPKIDKPDEVMSMVCEKGGIEFRDSAGTVRLTGEYIKDARMGYDADGEPTVYITFTEEGTELFAETTKDLAAKTDGSENILYVYLGETEIFAPTVNEEIPNGLATITDIEAIERAKAFVAALKSGTLNSGFTFECENR